MSNPGREFLRWVGKAQGIERINMRRVSRIAGVVAAIVFGWATAVSAHPLGNFTVNHLSRLTVDPTVVRVRYVLDEAEIPTFALDRSLDAHGTPSHDVLADWARRHAAAIAPQLRVTVDDRAVALVGHDAAVRLRPGAGGLPTLYFTATFSAALGRGAQSIRYSDETEPGRLGWRDVVVGAATEPTHELQRYPSALLGSPRTRTTVTAKLDAAGRIIATTDGGGDSVAAPASAPIARSNALSDVLAKGAHDPLVVMGALFLAIALGALHALEPGHGKTLLAVSLVGARATPRQALILATALTVAHTAGVLALGIVVLFATKWIVPEQVYPWITLASGMIVTLLGARALTREIRRRLPFAHAHVHYHPHAHPHRHEHVHVADEHHHGEHAHAIPGTAPLTFRNAVIAATSGNIAPCPAALVVLLTAITLQQIGYGLALIVAFSIGLASVLTVLGIAVVRGAAWLVARPGFERFARVAPLVTAFVIAAVGAVMLGQGLAQQMGTPALVVAVLVLAAVTGNAFAWHRNRAIVEVTA
jgi:nickel/cobalt transporter (NicO) family protein